MTTTQWLEVLLSFSLQVTLVLIVAYMLDRNARDSHTRSSIWTTVFWSVLLLVCSAVLLLRLHLFQPWSWLRPESVYSVVEAQILIGRLLLHIWGLGVGVGFVRWARQGYLLHRTLKRSVSATSPEQERLLSLGGFAMETTSRTRTPRILISDEIDGPFCWQFHEPTIVLPRFILAGSNDDLSHVMMHELEHLNTHHPLQLFLQNVVQVICWFHPLVWRATRHVSLIREFACDDAVLASGKNTVAYLRTLLRIAERSEPNNARLGFGRNRSEVIIRTRRLVSVTDSTPKAEWKLTRFASVSLLLFASVLASQVWLPVDALASSRTVWSPWPTWSATTLHSFGINARDYQPFEHRVLIHELREDRAETNAARSSTHR